MDKKRFEVHLFSNVFFKRAIILIFDLWLVISVAAADYFCVFHLYLTLLLSNTFTYLLVFTRLYGLNVKASDC